MLNGSLEELERLADETGRFCRENGFGDAVAFDLNLALEELFTNALRHGGCAGMREAVRVRLRAAGEGVWVEFSDRGRAFDPASAARPDLEAPLEARGIGGLGLHIVREVMRDLCYERAGEWNRITMRRPLAEEQP